MRRLLGTLMVVGLAAWAAGIQTGGSPVAAFVGSGNSHFIVRCFFDHALQDDPILYPGVQGGAAHKHDFYGNHNTTYASTDSSMEHTSSTSCQDSQDTAGYWTPQLLEEGSTTPWHPYDPSDPTNPSKNLNVRVYYVGDGSGIQAPPDGTIMVAGFPYGCNNVTGGGPAVTPPGCSDGNPWSSAGYVVYTCGANAQVNTPVSLWPYNCENYVARNGQGPGNIVFQPDGSVLLTYFPDCWNGNSSGTAPNSNPVVHVPQYVPSWVKSGYTSDLDYDVGGACVTPFIYPISQVSVRIHSLHQDPCDAGQSCEPSSCGSWNTNWGNQTWNHYCVPDSTPTVRQALSSGAWYTLHADFWETWQRGDPAAADSLGGNDPTSFKGMLNDLVEDCNVEATNCNFAIDGQFPNG